MNNIIIGRKSAEKNLELKKHNKEIFNKDKDKFLGKKRTLNDLKESSISQERNFKVNFSQKGESSEKNKKFRSKIESEDENLEFINKQLDEDNLILDISIESENVNKIN